MKLELIKKKHGGLEWRAQSIDRGVKTDNPRWRQTGLPDTGRREALNIDICLGARGQWWAVGSGQGAAGRTETETFIGPTTETS